MSGGKSQGRTRFGNLFPNLQTSHKPVGLEFEYTREIINLAHHSKPSILKGLDLLVETFEVWRFGVETSKPLRLEVVGGLQDKSDSRAVRAGSRALRDGDCGSAARAMKAIQELRVRDRGRCAMATAVALRESPNPKPNGHFGDRVEVGHGHSRV